MPAMGGALGSVAPHWSQLSLPKSLVAPQAGHVLSMLMAAGLKHMGILFSVGGGPPP